jgi:UDP-N-acetylglucosamine 2-epimerase
MKIVSVVGTRPQLIKAAALLPALRARHEEVFVDTGQHWDERMAGVFFAELGLPRPDHALGVGGGRHAGQTGRMLVALEPILEAEHPDAVLVYGDTNSTLAGSLAAAKLGIPVAHVEAGLRSFDRRMPEEINRVVADHLATWCFAPTPAAVANLAAEGITAGVVETGDLMQDLAARVAAEVRGPDALRLAGDALAAAGAPDLAAALRPGGFLLATIHRAENREPPALAAWPAILGDAARPDRPVILALHPGTRVALEGAGIVLPPGVRVVEPLGYRTSLTLQLHAAAVITDSGGVQREAAWLGTPCLVLRSSTEWVEAVADSAGRMVVVGLDRARAAHELARLAPAGTSEALARARAETLNLQPAGAARRIVEALETAR